MNENSKIGDRIAQLYDVSNQINNAMSALQSQ